jgi:hypothetical protein
MEHKNTKTVLFQVENRFAKNARMNPVVLAPGDSLASVRENCIPVIASAGTKADIPPSTVKAQNSSFVRCSVPHTPVSTK